MKHLSYALTLCLIPALFLGSCKKDSGPKSPDKSIANFAFTLADGTTISLKDIDMTTSNDTIHIVMPPFTDVTHLNPGITIDGKSISPAGNIPQNFSEPVVYTVTAQDGSKQTYTIVIATRGVVYIGGGFENNKFYALDALRGKLVWSDSAGDFSYSSPTIANGVVYAGNIDDNMYAMDAVTGKVKWRARTNSGIESSPTVANGMVYFGSDDHTFYAVDAATGTLRCQSLNATGVGSDPCVSGGNVYVTCDDGYLYAFDAVTGAQKWEFPFYGTGTSTPLVVE